MAEMWRKGENFCLTLFIPLLQMYSVKHTTGLGSLTLKRSLVLAQNYLEEFDVILTVHRR